MKTPPFQIPYKSNSFVARPSLTGDFEFSASDFRPQAGDLALLFLTAYPKKSTYILVIKELT